MAERPLQNLPTPIKALYDAAHLAQLHGLAFVDGAWSKSAFADLLEQKTVIALGHQNGFILLQILPDGVEILTLAVQIWLEVAADNYAAQALYSGFGFIEYGRRSKYYKRAGNFLVDAVLMRLDSQEGAQHEQKIGT